MNIASQLQFHVVDWTSDKPCNAVDCVIVLICRDCVIIEGGLYSPYRVPLTVYADNT